jgi:hypothetical protein
VERRYFFRLWGLEVVVAAKVSASDVFASVDYGKVTRPSLEFSDYVVGIFCFHLDSVAKRKAD